MKFKDLTKMSKEDVAKKLSELKNELMKLNAQIAVGTTPKNTKQVRDIKRTLAQIETNHIQKFNNEVTKISSVDKPVKNYKRL